MPVTREIGEKNDSLWRSRILPNPDVVAKRLDGEVVIVHLGTNEIYNLNSSAARLWELLESGLGLEDAKEQLIEEFDVSVERLEQDISATVASLVENQIVTLEK
jgi:hypothetical protein